MRQLLSLPCLLIAALSLTAPTALSAAAPTVNAGSQAILLHPLTLLKVEDMEFGALAVTGAGTAVMNPATNTMSTTGGVLAMTSARHAALFAGAASGGAVVNIKLPKNSITLTRVGGTETMTLSNFTLDGPTKRVMAKSGSFEFRVGGTLNVAANQVEGDYVGTFVVTAQYP
jgi:hypothetical protein